MSISILIICLLVQHLLLFDRYAYQLHWLENYFHWLINKVEYVTEGHAVVGVCILLMPVVIIVSISFSLVYHFFGVIVYYLLNLGLVWICVDGRDLLKKPYTQVRTADFFVLSYERLFAVIFWYVVLGPAGLILYTATISLRNFLHGEKHQHLLFYVLKLKALLDWVPVRLLCFSYGIVGHFAGVTKLWPRCWLAGLEVDAQLSVVCGCAALNLPKDALENARMAVIHLINRALLLWLIVISLFTLAFWLA